MIMMPGWIGVLVDPEQFIYRKEEVK